MSVQRPERDRDIFKVLRAIRGKSASEVSRQTYVCAQTIRNMRSGQTKFPRHSTLAGIAHTVGMQFVLLDEDEAREVKRTTAHTNGQTRHAHQ